MNGRLKTGSQTDSAVPVTFDTSIETPVTPPSMKLLDSRKPCRPRLAERMPSRISRLFSSSGVARVSARRSGARIGTEAPILLRPRHQSRHVGCVLTPECSNVGIGLYAGVALGVGSWIV